jgi:hypothetical protein
MKARSSTTELIIHTGLNLCLNKPRPRQVKPSNIAVRAPSGTPTGVVPNESLSVKTVCPLAEGLAAWKVPVNAVGSNPLPVTVPDRATFRNMIPPMDCKAPAEESRLKVKPPTVQKLLSGPELKVHGDARATVVPVEIPANAPEDLPTVVSIQETTLVAVWTFAASSWAVPSKPMLPLMGMAWRFNGMAIAKIAKAREAIVLLFIGGFPVTHRSELVFSVYFHSS